MGIIDVREVQLDMADISTSDAGLKKKNTTLFR